MIRICYTMLRELLGIDGKRFRNDVRSVAVGCRYAEVYVLTGCRRTGQLDDVVRGRGLHPAGRIADADGHGQVAGEYHGTFPCDTLLQVGQRCAAECDGVARALFLTAGIVADQVFHYSRNQRRDCGNACAVVMQYGSRPFLRPLNEDSTASVVRPHNFIVRIPLERKLNIVVLIRHKRQQVGNR